MNLLLNPNTISMSNSFLLDTKNNIIMDGTFTKLVYSTAEFTMNGIHLIFPIRITQTTRVPNKNLMLFDIEYNKDTIRKFIEIERDLLQLYSSHFPQSRAKNHTHTLKSQMMKGAIKYYHSMHEYGHHNRQFYIVISGIWENAVEIGITYKIIEHM